MRVLLLTRYTRLGASSRVRFLQFLPRLADQGIEVDVCPFFDDAHLTRTYNGLKASKLASLPSFLRRAMALTRIHSYDVVWIEKEVFPWLPAPLELALLHRIPYVVDFDDALHLRYQRLPEPFYRLLGGKLEQIVRKAAIVTVGNELLADWANRAGARRVEHLPPVVDLSVFILSPPITHQRFTIGWIGTPITEPYLEVVRGALERVLSCPDTRLLLIGGRDFKIPGAKVELHPWSETTTSDLLREIDVGIAPLPYGDWERHKSGYKIIQYLSHAKATIASPVGASQLIIEDGITGLFASSEEEWVSKLGRLRQERSVATRLGEAGRRKVEQLFSLELRLPQVAKILKQAAKQSPPAHSSR